MAGRPKKKPEYNPELQFNNFLQELRDAYEEADSLRSLADELNISLLKLRKLLITADVFTSDICTEINALHQSGKKIPEIMKLTGLSRASVHSYLPYTKGIYPPAVFDSNKSEILLSTENKLKEIYEAFPNEGKVVLGYSYLVSWNYVTWLDFPRPIDEELIPLFKKWIRKFPENKLELMEYYSFILFEKWLYMDSLDNISEANKIYYEIKAIADELSKDYADNQVTQMLSMGIVRKL